MNIFSKIDCGPTDILSPDRTIKYVENQPLNVQVRVKNFGLYGIDTIKVTAILKYKSDTNHIIQSINQTFIHSLSSLESNDVTLSSPLYPPHFKNGGKRLTFPLCIYKLKWRFNPNQ